MSLLPLWLSLVNSSTKGTSDVASSSTAHPEFRIDKMQSSYRMALAISDDVCQLLFAASVHHEYAVVDKLVGGTGQT
jgi:hypothetical protein